MRPPKRLRKATTSQQARRLREELTERKREFEAGQFGTYYAYGDDDELDALHERLWNLPVEFIQAQDQETYEFTVELLMEQAADKRGRLTLRREPRRTR